MPNTKISVLLVVKNAIPLVKGTLDSLRRQTFRDFEVIVADGVSTDGTLEVLREAANDLPLRIVSEPDRSLAEALAKGLCRATGGIVGMLCADERYYPNTLEQVFKWFEADPNAIVCSGKVDFIDEYDRGMDRYLTAPFNLPAHLACELVPSILSSFFNRPLIGEDFYYDAAVPTCPDYEFWARLGFRFPPSAFKRYDVSVAQAYRTRDLMSFRAESFTQFCRDKLTHLNNLLARGYAGSDHKGLRRRACAGIHMWAAEQLNSIEPAHADILAHCAKAARYDKSYERIARFIATGNASYDATTGRVMRSVPDHPTPQTTAVTSFACHPPPAYWAGAAILERDPLVLRTAKEAWGFSAVLSISQRVALGKHPNGGQYWARVDLEVDEGCIGIGIFGPKQNLIGEMIFRQTDGRKLAFIPLPADLDPATPLMVRSGGHPSSIVHIHRAELLRDFVRASSPIAPLEL